MLPFCRLPRGYVTGDFVRIEDLPDRRQEPRELSGERRVVPRGGGERSQLLADQVVEGALRAKTSPDGSCGLGLLDPDLLESHGGNISADSTNRNLAEAVPGLTTFGPALRAYL
jgi:hypothetical protein